MTARFELVIFDCDGVLVDTETVANTAMAQWISDSGVPLSMAQCRARFVGGSMESVREKVLAEDGVDLGADFVERWRAALPAIFAAGVPAIKGVADVLDRLDDRGLPYCVASSGTIDKMHLTLGSAGLLARLEPVLFSATMVAHGKPAPDLFLHAARAMGYAPAQCAVIEDSRFGAQAARRAGMACFGYCGDLLTDSAGLAAEGAVPFQDMARLPALLGIAVDDPVRPGVADIA